MAGANLKLICIMYKKKGHSYQKRREVLFIMKNQPISPQDQKRNQEYNEFVKQVTPTHNLWLNMLKAFLLGGFICLIGQFIIGVATNSFGLEEKDAGSWCSLILILCSVILTSLNLYPSLANWGGAGALVPITGFANGVASSAIEFKKDVSVIIGTRSKKPRKIKGFR